MKTAANPNENATSMTDNHSNGIKGNTPPQTTLTVNSRRQAQLLDALVQGERSNRYLIDHLNINQPPEIISKLRRKGWNIKTHWESVKNRYSETVRAGRYELDPSQLEDAKQAISAFTQSVKPKGFE